MTLHSKLILVACLLGLASPAMAQSGCGGQFKGGTLCGNNTALQGIPGPSNSIVLGIPGTTAGTLALSGLSSGQVTIMPQSAAGSITLTLPNTAGTLPSTASTPLVLNTTTGVLTCPTCVTSSGGTISGTSPINVSGAGVISLTTPLALNFGGTNANLTASNGGIVWSNATQLQILSGTATARQMLQSGASATPAWSTATYPATTTINQLLYSSASQTVTGLATANGSLLNTSSGGVPSLTPTPVLGVAGTTVGSIGFQNASTGTVTLQPVTGALGTVTIGIPSAAGTLAVSASTPITLNATTGALACSTCGVTGSPLSQFASTTSAQLAGIISDETGTGSLVFATSPTFSTSITATGLIKFTDLATAAIATQSQYFTGTASTIVPTSVIYSAETTTTFSATTVFDFNTFINTAVTLTGNITTQTLNNVKAGQSGQIRFIQDTTGSRTSVWNTIFKFSGGLTPTLTTTPSAVDALVYNCVSTSYCVASLIQNVK